MLRMIARWLISRSIDEGHRLPGWMRRWIDRDDELNQFEMLSQQLGCRLKNDALGWITSQSLSVGGKSTGRQEIVPGQRAPNRRKRRLAWSLAALSVAACAGFAIARLRWERGPLERAISSGDRTIAQMPAVATITEADREWLAAAWNTSRANLNQWHARADGLSRRAQRWMSPGVSIVEPVQVAGSTAGRALATLRRSMDSEQEQLTSDMKTALSFFAYRLPVSAGKLVGWPRFHMDAKAPNG